MIILSVKSLPCPYAYKQHLTKIPNFSSVTNQKLSRVICKRCAFTLDPKTNSESLYLHLLPVAPPACSTALCLASRMDITS